MMSEKQIKERIYKLQDEVRILESVLETKREGFGRPKGSIKYNQEQIKFLYDNRDTPMAELVTAFNKQFGTKYHSESRTLYNFMCREGILTAPTAPTQIKMTKQEIRLLK